MALLLFKNSHHGTTNFIIYIDAFFVFISVEMFSVHYGNVTIAGEGLPILTYTRHQGTKGNGVVRVL